jgi:hypothetical protein
MTNDPPKAAASAINLKLIPHYSDDPRPVLVRLPTTAPAAPIHQNR